MVIWNSGINLKVSTDCRDTTCFAETQCKQPPAKYCTVIRIATVLSESLCLQKTWTLHTNKPTLPKCSYGKTCNGKRAYFLFYITVCMMHLLPSVSLFSTTLPSIFVCEAEGQNDLLWFREQSVFLEISAQPIFHLDARFDSLINWSNSSTRDDGRRCWWAPSILSCYHEEACLQLRRTDGRGSEDRGILMCWERLSNCRKL